MKKILVFLATTSFLLMLVPISAQAAFDGYYRITSKYSGKVLQITASSMDNGAKLQQWTSNGGAQQVWRIIDQGDGYFEIVAKHSQKCLDVPGSTSNDVQLQQYGDNNTNAQRWQIIDTGDGYFKIKSKVSGKCLDLYSYNTTDGAPVYQYTDNGADNQKWQIVKVNKSFFVGYYRFISKYNGKAMDIPNSSISDGARVQIWTPNGGDAQNFRIVDDGDGYYRIYNKNSERNFDVVNASTSVGAEIQQLGAKNNDAQRFIITDAGNGYYSIVNKNSGKCLDINVDLGQTANDGTKVVQHIFNGNDKQLWRLEQTSTGQILADGYYRLRNKNSSKIMDVSGASLDDNARIIQWTSHTGENQVWLVQYDQNDGTYMLTAKHSEKVLDVPGLSLDNDTDMIQYGRNDGDNQKFSITLVEAGYYKICSKKSGRCIEVANSSTSDGGTVQQWAFTNINCQKWSIETWVPGQATYVPGPGPCATLYPLLLVHGVAVADSTIGFNYFGRIPGRLRENGAVVEGGGQDAWSSSTDNGLQLKNKIEWMRTYYGVSKVNIIAHSKGGIDARAMLRDYPETREWVASFTALASPMRGSVLADIIFGLCPDWAEPFVTGIINVIGKVLQGDDSPDAMAAGLQLQRDVMTTFNNDLAAEDSLATGRTGIFTQSYAAKIKGLVLDLALQATGICMSLGGESPNDGAVWTSSAPYGQFKGVVDGAWWCGGVTHFGICDRGILVFPGFTPGFDARSWYVDRVSELKNWGY